jgi:hypothetical protein
MVVRWYNQLVGADQPGNGSERINFLSRRPIAQWSEN